MAGPTVFKAPPREAVIVQVGDEEVDLSRLPMGALLDVIALIGDDGETPDLANVVAAIAALCEPSNPRVTTEYLLGLDAEVVLPFMQFAMRIVEERMAAGRMVGIKNGKTPSR